MAASDARLTTSTSRANSQKRDPFRAAVTGSAVRGNVEVEASPKCSLDEDEKLPFLTGGEWVGVSNGVELRVELSSSRAAETPRDIMILDDTEAGCAWDSGPSREPVTSSPGDPLRLVRLP